MTTATSASAPATPSAPMPAGGMTSVNLFRGEQKVHSTIYEGAGVLAKVYVKNDALPSKPPAACVLLSDKPFKGSHKFAKAKDCAKVVRFDAVNEGIGDADAPFTTSLYVKHEWPGSSSPVIHAAIEPA